MGVKGLFTFLNRGEIEGAIVEHSIDDISQEIRSYRDKHQKAPKILINLRIFNNYYEQSGRDVIFGCRFNAIKDDFESFLATLKYAGAKLIFVSKKSQLDQIEEVNFADIDKNYRKGLELVRELKSGKSIKELERRVRGNRYPWQDTAVNVLVQSAQKYGTFHEGDCFMNTTASYMKLANDEDVYAVFGLNTSYLFYKGSWKIFFPEKEVRSGRMVIKEFDKIKIRDHFRLTDDQFRLFSVLGGKIDAAMEHMKTLRDHFKGEKGMNFNAIATFTRHFAPANKFPLQTETIDKILFEIFGYASDDEKLREDFIEAMSYDCHPKPLGNVCAIDEKLKMLLQRDSFSTFAEGIFYDIPLEVLSPFLDVKATDMKTLEELTKDWIERLGGILLKDINVDRSFSIVYRMRSGDLQKYQATPQIPFGIPDWQQLIANEVTMNEKFQTLEFLLGDIISIEDLKTIPLQFLMHVIITMHMLKNDSMTMKEAIAMTKALSVPNEDAFTIYPKQVNDRAFRVSSLYEKMYSVLLMCLSPLGLSDFVAELKLDNVRFQNILNETESTDDTTDAFKIIMEILSKKYDFPKLSKLFQRNQKPN